MKREEAMPRGWARCWRSRFAAVVIAAASVGMASPFQAQEAVVLRTASCVRCSIAVSTLAVLQTQPDAIPAFPWSFSHDARGRVYVLQPDERLPPLVFAPDGRLIRVLGRRGNGPGEYQGASALAAAVGDTLYVADRPGRRLTVLDPEWRFVRRAPLPGAVTAMASTVDGALVVNARLADRERFGQPYHIVDRLGNHVRSFGHDRTQPLLPDEGWRMLRVLTPDRESGFWGAAVYGEFRIEHWSADGRLRSSFIRKTEWLPNLRGPVPVISPTSPPGPSIRGITQDSAGRIWILALVADTSWHRGLSRGRQEAEAGVSYDIDNLDRTFDSIIEVIDPRRRVVLVSTRIDEAYGYALPGGRAVHIQVGRDGERRVRVVRLHLTGAE